MKKIRWILLFLAAAACFFYYDVKRYYVGRSFFDYNLLPMNANTLAARWGRNTNDTSISYLMIMREDFWAMMSGYTKSLTFRDMDMTLLIISLWATSWAITIMTVGSSSYAWTRKTA